MCGTRVDEAVEAQPGQVVAGLVDGVGGAPSRPVIRARRLLLVKPVTAQQADAQGAGQGQDPRVAEPQGRGPPAILGEGGPRDPLKGWTRKDTALADTFSIEQAAVDRTGLGLQLVEMGRRRGSPGRRVR